MSKIIIYFLIFIGCFANDNLNIKDLDLTIKNKIKFVTLDSLNESGFYIEKAEDGFFIATDLGTFIFKDTEIITPHKTFRIISSPFIKNGKTYLPLEIILTLNGYSLKDGNIKKDEDIALPKSYPTRIISLSPGITEKIFALGGEDLLVGRTSFSSYPKEVKNIDIVGTMFEPNLEIILEKKPNIIIAESHFRDKLMITLKSFDIEVAKFNTPTNIPEIYSSITDLGSLIGRNLEARGLNASLQDKVSYTKAILEDEKKPKVYYVLGSGKTDITPGGDTFINFLMEIAGGINIASDKIGWRFSLEELILNDPDIIFGGKRNIDTMLKEENYHYLSAIQNKNYFIIKDDSIFNLPGPRALTEGIYQMGIIFHPEKAQELEKIRSLE
jgi:iron complex transport system substrate-binding protein